MQREIKFRAWDRDYKEMTYQSSTVDAAKILSGYDVVMQFTGLHDKNGKEIYEGDIVHVERMPASPDVEEFISKVYFFDGCFMMDLDDDVGFPLHVTTYREPDNGYKPIKLEVIGNIHENPEKGSGPQ